MSLRNDWTLSEVKEFFDLPFMDLVFKAHELHRRFQAPNTVQIMPGERIGLSISPDAVRLLPPES